jgi:hypothetical protein
MPKDFVWTFRHPTVYRIQTLWQIFSDTSYMVIHSETHMDRYIYSDWQTMIACH